MNRTRRILAQLCQEDEQGELFGPSASPPPGEAKPLAIASQAPQQPTKRGTWIVKSLRGMNIDDIYSSEDDRMTMVIGEVPASPYDGRPKATRIGVIGSGGKNSYGPVGSEVYVKIDMGGGGRGYRFIGGPQTPIKIVAYADQVSKAAARSYGVRSLYHFD